MKAEAGVGNEKGIPPSVPLSPTHWRQQTQTQTHHLYDGIIAEFIDIET